MKRQTFVNANILTMEMNYCTFFRKIYLFVVAINFALLIKIKHNDTNLINLIHQLNKYITWDELLTIFIKILYKLKNIVCIPFLFNIIEIFFKSKSKNIILKNQIRNIIVIVYDITLNKYLICQRRNQFLSTCFRI